MSPQSATSIRPRQSSIPRPCARPKPSAPPYAAGTRPKKLNGRKRHIIVDTLGLLLVVASPPPASKTDDGARTALQTLWELFSVIVLV
ncbi:hypothetical protein [Nocardia sp. NPDC059228]|uniref:hypothetical protein n=1 Tax=Nocardia sp. NPDC059228 TaxID=3346777 RepID=UPI003680AB97